jgi:hypothetical protein
MTRRDLGNATVAVGCALLAGLLVGLVWHGAAPVARLVVTGEGVFFSRSEDQSFIAADGIFTVLSLVVGLASGVLGYRLLRPTAPAVVAGLAVGGLLGALSAWGIGCRLGPAPVAERAARLPAGAHLDAALTLRAHAAVFVWPLAAVAAYVVLVTVVERVTPAARSVPSTPG